MSFFGGVLIFWGNECEQIFTVKRYQSIFCIQTMRNKNTQNFHILGPVVISKPSAKLCLSPSDTNCIGSTNYTGSDAFLKIFIVIFWLCTPSN